MCEIIYLIDTLEDRIQKLQKLRENHVKVGWDSLVELTYTIAIEKLINRKNLIQAKVLRNEVEAVYLQGSNLNG